MAGTGQESTSEMRERLQGVLGLSEMVVLPGTWSFLESPKDQPPLLDEHVLAVVRDDETWSVLRQAEEQDGREQWGVLSFHFPDGVDTSGLVGWLATALQEQLGTGVLVIRGSNSDRGGMYDYWGCPHELLDQAVAVVHRLTT